MLFEEKGGILLYSLSIRTSVYNVTPLLIDHLSKNLKTFTGDSPMDEDWNAFGILMCREICDGAGTGNAMALHRLAPLV